MILVPGKAHFEVVAGRYGRKMQRSIALKASK
jgi:hypothetical protein